MTNDKQNTILFYFTDNAKKALYQQSVTCAEKLFSVNGIEKKLGSSGIEVMVVRKDKPTTNMKKYKSTYDEVFLIADDTSKGKFVNMASKIGVAVVPVTNVLNHFCASTSSYDMVI